MTTWIRIVTISLGLTALACSGGSKGTTTPAGGGTAGTEDTGDKAAKPADPNAAYGPLEVGADWESYTKVNTEPVMSPTHGKRFVDTYVNDVGLAAYQDASVEEMPVGSVIVKTSWEPEDGAPTDVRGPIFIMEKKDAGYNEDTNNWYYAFHWENVAPKWQQRLGAQVYWRSPSTKVKYCYECHENYERELGMVPKDKRAWGE